MVTGDCFQSCLGAVGSNVYRVTPTRIDTASGAPTYVGVARCSPGYVDDSAENREECIRDRYLTEW